MFNCNVIEVFGSMYRYIDYFDQLFQYLLWSKSFDCSLVIYFLIVYNRCSIKLFAKLFSYLAHLKLCIDIFAAPSGSFCLAYGITLFLISFKVMKFTVWNEQFNQYNWRISQRLIYVCTVGERKKTKRVHTHYAAKVYFNSFFYVRMKLVGLYNIWPSQDFSLFCS